MSTQEPKNRITVLEQVYHQPTDGEPEVFQSRYVRQLTSKEQPYTRKLKATEVWTLLECGWLPAAGMLLITNDEGINLQTIPSEEQRQELASRVIEVGYGCHDPVQGAWEIHPGESMRACPTDASGLYVRCRKGTARFTLHLLPR